MEPLFENYYIITKELLLKWAKTPTRKTIYIVLKSIAVLCVLSFAFALCLSVIIHDLYYFIFSFVGIIFGLYWLFFRTRVIISRQYKIRRSTQQGDEWFRIIKFTDQIDVIENNSSSNFQYGQISGIKEFDNFCFLYFNKNIGLRILKDGFRTGDYDSFIAFISEKCPNIKKTSNTKTFN